LRDVEKKQSDNFRFWRALKKAMAPPPQRRSDRIAHEMPIHIYGTDVSGQAFEMDGKTCLLSRHGAAIVIKRRLNAEQVITVQRREAGKEADARIVGLVGQKSGAHVYGIAFLDATANLWDIEFPPLSESENAVGRSVLECRHCGSRELVYLDEFEAEVFEANRGIYRECKRCRDRTYWREAAGEASGEAEPTPPPPPPPRSLPIGEKRKFGRAKVKLTALIRRPPDIEEVIKTENVSRSGLCFRSRRGYDVGLSLEVCLPYTGGRANIFLPAKIVRSHELPGEYLLAEYGIEYVRTFGV
jgi:PilZ domain